MRLKVPGIMSYTPSRTGCQGLFPGRLQRSSSQTSLVGRSYRCSRNRQPRNKPLPRTALLDTIDGIYEAVHDPSLWQTIVESMLEHLDADAGDLVTEDEENRATRIFGSAGYDTFHLQAYRSDFVGKDILSRAARMSRLTGTITTESSFIDQKAFRDSEFLNEWMLPQGDLRFGAGSVLVNESGTFTNFYAMRQRSKGPFGGSQLRYLDRLEPHLRRSIDLSKRLQSLQTELDASLLSVDRCGVPMAVIDDARRIHHVSGPMEEIFARSGQLARSTSGTLLAVDSRDNRLLDEAVQRAFRAVKGCDPPGEKQHHESFIALRGRHLDPLGLLVFPAPASSAGCDEKLWRVVVVAIDPGGPHGSQIEWLEQLFGLTKTEANFALHFSRGRSVEECAEALDLAIGTARWHLKNIRAKTGTQRQADLARLLGNVLRLSKKN